MNNTDAITTRERHAKIHLRAVHGDLMIIENSIEEHDYKEALVWIADAIRELSAARNLVDSAVWIKHAKEKTS